MRQSNFDPKKISPNVYGNRRSVKGKIVAIMHATYEKRGLDLIDPRSRVLTRDEIHELMITDEPDAAPGGRADRVSVIAFFEITQGGLAVVGDEVSISGTALGELAGYDLTHMPNHMNVVVKRKNLEVPDIKIEDEIIFSRKF